MASSSTQYYRICFELTFAVKFSVRRLGVVASIEKFLSRMLKCNFGLFESAAGKFPRCEFAAMGSRRESTGTDVYAVQGKLRLSGA
ncbi:hypothetical protein U1Q18_046614 [Sarracenia purpurea var. burkii]